MKNFIFIFICFTLTGCGTIFNLSRPVELEHGEIAMENMPTMQYYGGVKTSVEAGAMGLLDIPFSAVADTFTLPVVYFSMPDEPTPTAKKPNSTPEKNSSQPKK